MSSITVILLACIALASGYYMKKDVKYADHDFLVKQKFVFEVFQHIHQDEVWIKKYKHIFDYKLLDHVDNFEHVEYVKSFYKYYESHFMAEDEIFTVLDETEMKYMMYFYNTLVYAKDFDTFHDTVLWARTHINKGVFLFGFSAAVLHRKDMAGIILPPIYEVYPYYFFDSETMQAAQHYKMKGFYDVKMVEDVYTVIIPANYTGEFGHYNDDNMLSYFMEDVGLNAFYYYYNLDYPYWTAGYGDNLLKKDRRGEFYFHLHWQILARYYMERLSNNLGEIPEMNWYEDLPVGYYSGLRFYNGIYFPDRENDFSAYHHHNYYDIEMLEMFDRRIMMAIDLGYMVLPDGTHYEFKDFHTTIEALGNMVQGNVDSLNVKMYGYFDLLFRKILNFGISHDHNEHELPGMLMHYETSMRDPLFYEMYKRILKYYFYYLEHLPSYTEEELFFQGVKVSGVEMDKLITFFDHFDADITNAVEVELLDDSHEGSDLYKFGRFANYHGHDFVIKARQHRLNHVPFTTKVNVHSDKAQKGVVKFFIAPVYDHFGDVIPLWENRKNFFELDRFVYDFVAGDNFIVRSSNDFSWWVKDRTPYYQLYKELMLSLNSDSHKFPLDMSEAHCGLPMRLMLPKGKKGGMPFQFFFMVMPFHEPEVKQFTGYDPITSCGVGTGARYVDDMPFGFPFDRKIDHFGWNYDNMFFYKTMIYHKVESELNVIH